MGFLQLFNPHQYADSLADIDIAALKSRDFDCLLLDLDNTMLPWKSSEIPESSRQWVENAQQMGMKLCIVSNTHYPKRLHKIAQDLDIPSLDRAIKPRRSGFEKALKMLNSEPANAVIIGDQLLTDICGGNLMGIYTILVKPMHNTEFFGTKLSRLVEFGILALLRRRGEWGTKSGRIQSETQDTK